MTDPLNADLRAAYAKLPSKPMKSATERAAEQAASRAHGLASIDPAKLMEHLRNPHQHQLGQGHVPATALADLIALHERLHDHPHDLTREQP